MIRVNLLPHARDQRTAPEGSQLWLLAIMGGVLLEIVGLFFFHQTKVDQLTEVQDEANKQERQINEIRAFVKDHEKIKEELKVLRAREDAIAKLQQGRKGPTAVLLELSHVLTRGRGPTVDAATAQQQRDNPLLELNASWDTRRLWLTRVEENERQVRLEGRARDGSDVYEFAQRLKLSHYFSDVQLLSGELKGELKTNVDMASFALQVKAKY